MHAIPYLMRTLEMYRANGPASAASRPLIPWYWCVVEMLKLTKNSYVLFKKPKICECLPKLEFSIFEFQLRVNFSKTSHRSVFVKMTKAEKRKRPDTKNTPSKKQKRAAASTPKVQRGFMGARGEAKYRDRGVVTALCRDTGVIFHLNPIPQGTGVTQRDGRIAQCTSVQLRGSVRTGAQGDLKQACAYLVWDLQVNKAAPNVVDILDAGGALSLPRRENTSRFKFIKKWRWALAGHTGTTGNPIDGGIYDIDEYIRLPSYCVSEWTSTDTTGELTNCVKGALYLVVTGDATIDANAATLQVYPRVNFKDI